MASKPKPKKAKAKAKPAPKKKAAPKRAAARPAARPAATNRRAATAAGKPAAAKPAAAKPAAAKPSAGKPAAGTGAAGRPAAPPAAPVPGPGARAPAPAGAPAAPARRPGKPRGPKPPALPQLPPGVAPFPALEGQVKYEEPLGRHTTFRIGGPAMVLFQPENAAAVGHAVAWARANKVPWLVLGLGSNVLIRDGGFRGLVIKIGKGLDELSVKGRVWKAGAGLPTPLLARRTAEAGFEGVQRLVGVPGTVGGGVYMNAGAHGQDFAKVLQSVTVMTPQGAVVEKPRSAIPFSYRRSGLEDNVVLGCTLQLSESSPERVKADLNFVLKKRREGTPFDQPCCGSVFKNPPDSTAGKLIEQCKLKGRRVGGAEISMMHANYIVNRGGATADDVLKLIDVARTAVFKEFGVELELEVKVLGAAAK